MSENKNSIHPLVATAAGAVILASLVGVASMTGMLPSKNQAATEVAASAPSAIAEVPAQDIAAPVAAVAPVEPVAEVVPTPAVAATPAVVKPKPVVQAKPKPVIKEVDKVVTQHEEKPMPVEKAICLACGTVESVTSREEKAEKGSGVGAVAGALLGGVIGNQVGGGNGKKLATVAGAIGGGMAGNEIEKRKNSTMVYEVKVRMDNGEMRTFKPTNAPEWRTGDKVKVVEGQLTFQ